MQDFNLTGNKAGSIILIPRLNLISNNETLSVRFQRRQFSIIMSFAMTINKSRNKLYRKLEFTFQGYQGIKG
ncbi:hypothetical protein Ahy_A01g003157 [Arachis hypogaea]|uniref:ATP-dependent DNA helicase n=1 Tax=Arachis hypogaea TaxID=3818 RepID=A0A445ESP1_ARAHY|nr:hypothetical protein Ahy_A01g003157 [Arachis hypogaea]